MVVLVKKKSLQRMVRDIFCEKCLFYGMSFDVVDFICKQNFDWCVCGKSGIKYGQGSYFVVKVFYSYLYVICGLDGFWFMFLVRVLVGLFIKGEFKY